MSTLLWAMALAVPFLVVLSAFFSGSETALTAASRARMLALERSGDHRAGIVGRLIQERERLIGALLLGTSWISAFTCSAASSIESAVARTIALPLAGLTFL